MSGNDEKGDVNSCWFHAGALGNQKANIMSCPTENIEA